MRTTFISHLSTFHYQPLGGVCLSIQYHILYRLQQLGRDVVVAHRGGGVHDTHVHAGLDGVVEEHGVHGLAQVVVATEGKGEVAHTTAHVSSGQVGAYPLRGADEVEGIGVVCLDTRGHGKDVGVEDDVLWRHAHHVDQQVIGTLADGDATLISVGLPLFVEGHHHHGSTEAAYLAGTSKEWLFALLERYGVDHALALYALDGCGDDLPLRGVHHDGHAGNVGLRGDEVEEMHHLLLGVEQAIVHIDIEQLGSILHLVAGDGECFVIFLFVDKSKELARAGHVATLAHVDEVALGSHLAQFKSREPQGIGTWGRHVGLGTLDKGGIFGDVGIGGATASADDVDQSLGDILFHLHGHLGGCLVIAAEAVGESCIGVARDVVGGTCGKCLEVGFHLCGTERAVESHREDIGMAHRGEERVEGLSREGAPSGIGDGHREHDGQALAHALHYAFGGIDGCLGVECVEDGLDEQCIHTALDEGLDLFVIGFHQLVVGDAA